MVESEQGNSPVEALEEKLRLARSVWLRSKRYWIALPVSFVLACFAAWAAPKVMKPQYRSEVILTLQQGMRSRTLAGLQDGGGSSWNARLRELLMSAPNVGELIEKERLSPSWVAEVGMARAVEKMRQAISFAGGGETFVIGFLSSDPALAQRVARRLGDQLIREVRRQSSERTGSTRGFLEQEEQRLAEELRAVDTEYAEFISQHPEFAPLDSPSAASRGALSRQAAPMGAAADGEASVGALQRQAARLRARLAQRRTSGNAPLPTTSPTLELTPESKAAIDAATQEVQRATKDYDALKSKYTERHPDVVKAQTQLVAAQARLQRAKAAAITIAQPSVATENSLPPNPNEEQALARQLRQVESSLQRGRGMVRPQEDVPDAAHRDESARTIVGLETRWADIGRRRQSLRGQYAQIENSLFSANVLDKAQAVGGGDELVIAEPAYLPKLPFSRGPRRTAAGAAALIMALGAGIMLGLGFLDQRIRTEWDLARLELAPVVVVIPALEPERGTGRS